MHALRQSRLLNHAAGAMLAAGWLLFAVIHINKFLASGDWSYLLFMLSETLIAVLFVLRNTPQALSHAPVDWALAIAGTFAPFVFMPSGDGLLSEGRYLILLGMLTQIAGLLSLNSSFGLVAARRGVKTGGMYRFVRHPLYASYLLGYIGYLLVNSSLYNLLVVTLAAMLLVGRMVREERFLSHDSNYVLYMRRVKYRVLPLVF